MLHYLMQRQRKMWGLIAGVMLALSGPWAGRGFAEIPHASARLAQISGTIISVDPLTGTLTLEQASASPTEHPIEFLVDETTKVSKGGIQLTVRDLQATDERVIIQYEDQGSQRVARAVEFEKPAGLAKISGTITSIDLLSGGVAVKPHGLFSRGKEHTFLLDERTLVSQHGGRSSLAYSRLGDDVEIEYALVGDTAVAYVVNLKTPRGNPKLEIQRHGTQPSGQSRGMTNSSPSKQ